MELNPFSFEFHQDPYPVYRWLRDNAPCYHNEALGFFALSRYADVLDASRDWDTFSSADGPQIEATDRRWLEALPMMISLDPPRHDLLRSLVSRAFTPRRIAALEQQVREIAVGYLDRLMDARGGDFVREFSALLPMDVTFTMLGVPTEDRNRLREWTDRSLERDDGSPAVPPRALEANAALVGYWFDLLADRRRAPGDDLVSDLAQVRLPGDDRRLTDAEVVGFCTLIGAAGNETLTKLLANTVVLLARNPDEREKTVASPERVPAVLEEALRYWAPSQYQGRTATRDLQLHGQRVPAGARVILLTGSATRDERQYEEPDEFRPDREQATALGFGHGVHFCLGASLARLEGRVGLTEFLSRFPRYDIDESGVRRVHGSNVHGFESVPFAAVG